MHHGWYNAGIGICSTVCDFGYGGGVMVNNRGWGEYPMPKEPMAEINETKEVVLRRSDMTLRDYFAGQALVGIVNVFGSLKGAETGTMAEAAYEYADAMLEARK